jgi:hypothetical protein
MKPRLSRSILDSIKKIWNDDEEMFKIGMGLKFVTISLFCLLSVLLFTYLLIRIDLIFFISNGFPGVIEFQSAFYDYIYSSLFEEFIWICISTCFVFGLGYYLAGVVIRPFREIGKYCDDKLSNKTNFYSPDFFSDLKLLTSFSVFFFSRIDEASIKGKLTAIDLPDHFKGIHKPNFEKTFLFNYLFVIIIFALLSSLGIILLNTEIRDNVFELSRKFLAKNGQIAYFLEEQFIIADIAVYFFTFLHILLYFILGAHLYSKIATPAFAVFATLRSFLKGNYHNRIHLLGYSYLRNDCRKINKYLDHVQKNLT